MQEHTEYRNLAHVLEKAVAIPKKATCSYAQTIHCRRLQTEGRNYCSIVSGYVAYLTVRIVW